jgi:hypothetical protein
MMAHDLGYYLLSTVITHICLELFEQSAHHMVQQSLQKALRTSAIPSKKNAHYKAVKDDRKAGKVQARQARIANKCALKKVMHHSRSKMLVPAAPATSLPADPVYLSMPAATVVPTQKLGQKMDKKNFTPS